MSLQTPPCMARFKCSLISSATTITGPRGKLKTQMEAGRGGKGERGEAGEGTGLSQEKGATKEITIKNTSIHNGVFFRPIPTEGTFKN